MGVCVGEGGDGDLELELMGVVKREDARAAIPTERPIKTRASHHAIAIRKERGGLEATHTHPRRPENSV